MAQIMDRLPLLDINPIKFQHVIIHCKGLHHCPFRESLLSTKNELKKNKLFLHLRNHNLFAKGLESYRSDQE